jgi:hypothetical protein
MAASAVVAANLLAGLINAAIDPRVRGSITGVPRRTHDDFAK